MLRLKKKVSRRADDDDNNGESNTTSSSSVIFVDDIEYMVVEILSRLPVKSLLRFKCVSKRWCSLIQDPYFVDLHSARSTTRPGATFFISRDFRGRNITFFGSTLYDGPHFYAVDYVSSIGDPVRSFDSFGPHFFIERYDYVKLTYTQILNGLLFMSFKEETVWIINPSIRKTILLTKSNIREEESFKNKDVVYDDQYNMRNSEYVTRPKYGFGFDPVTKKYKVICICKVFMYYVPPQYFLYNPLEGIDHEFDPQLLKIYYRCKVLTIEDVVVDCLRWRSTDEMPPSSLAGDPVYLNGALYWRNEVSYDQYEDVDDDADEYHPMMEMQVIVAFDISSERFSVIKIPDFVRRPEHHHGYNKQELYEVDRHLAILDNNTTEPNTVAIWKLVVAPHEAAAAAKSTDCCWVKETILTLSFDWRTEWYLFQFEVIGGTNQILLKRSRGSSSGSSFFCYYNRDSYIVDHGNETKKKTGNGEKKLEFNGKAASFISSFTGGRTFHTCTESLWSLNN